MSDDTRRILDLLANGKINADEAEQLLRAAATAGEDPGPSAPPQAAAADPKFLRIEVRRTRRATAIPGLRDAGFDWGRDKTVNIRVPLTMVRGGMRLGALIPGTGERIQEALRDKGIDLDWSKLDRAELAAMLKDLGELTVDVDNGRAQVKITAE